MKDNLLGQLLLLKTMGIKPNYSELARVYGMDRHTIKKYFENGGKMERKGNDRKSIYDKYIDDIENQFSKPGVNKIGAYEFLKDKYGKDNIGSYSGFRHYTVRKGLKIQKAQIPHVRFETPPGKQLQNDWKEDIKLKDKEGNEYNFNIMTSTLGYSRMHIFVYSTSKTTEAYLRCLIDTLNKIGGCPNEILTDNMAAVVSIKNGSKNKHGKILTFEKDTGIKIKLCKARSPQTKGKDESSNRFINRLYSYDGEFKDEKELIEIIEKLNIEVNNQINQTTNMPPVVLFEKEKEYLSPLPNKVLLKDYVDTSFTQVVPPTQLISYKGSQYSVPAKYIGKRVKAYVIDNKLYIYFNTELINIHELSNIRFNYKKDDYIEGLSCVLKNKEIDIDSYALENLKAFDKMKGK
jgi:putative transposon-encoded protein